ncbi:MAG: hypothetical protein EXQ97_04145 [Alphaproteobacteria bacterium]|nr:hypothetical protein [Alphaproteobacteria bacterium]
MVGWATRRRSVALAIAAAFFAGIPALLLALPWLAVARAVVLPDTTCWIADADGQYILAAEAAVMLMIAGFLPWLLLSALCRAACGWSVCSVCASSSLT